ncbi:MAG: ATPase domain-containing protein, partial [Planctomycetota bacterium]
MVGDTQAVETALNSVFGEANIDPDVEKRLREFSREHQVQSGPAASGNEVIATRPEQKHIEQFISSEMEPMRMPSRNCKILTGIPGLDKVLCGGLAVAGNDSTSVVIKGPHGGGKTTLALQFACNLFNDPKLDGSIAYLTLEQKGQDIQMAMKQFSWCPDDSDIKIHSDFTDMDTLNELEKKPLFYVGQYPDTALRAFGEEHPESSPFFHYQSSLTSHIRNVVESLKHCEMIVIDSLTDPFVEEVSEGSYRLQRSLFHEICALGEEFNCTIVILLEKNHKLGWKDYVPNVVIDLGWKDDRSGRLVQIEKARFQEVLDGRHEMQIEPVTGISIRPNLPSLLRKAAKESYAEDRALVPQKFCTNTKFNQILGDPDGGLLKGSAALLYGPDATRKKAVVTQFLQQGVLDGWRAGGKVLFLVAGSTREVARKIMEQYVDRKALENLCREMRALLDDGEIDFENQTDFSKDDLMRLCGGEDEQVPGDKGWKEWQTLDEAERKARVELAFEKLFLPRVILFPITGFFESIDELAHQVGQFIDNNDGSAKNNIQRIAFDDIAAFGSDPFAVLPLKEFCSLKGVTTLFVHTVESGLESPIREHFDTFIQSRFLLLPNRVNNRIGYSAKYVDGTSTRAGRSWEVGFEDGQLTVQDSFREYVEDREGKLHLLPLTLSLYGEYKSLEDFWQSEAETIFGHQEHKTDNFRFFHVGGFQKHLAKFEIMASRCEMEETWVSNVDEFAFDYLVKTGKLECIDPHLSQFKNPGDETFHKLAWQRGKSNLDAKQYGLPHRIDFGVYTVRTDIVKDFGYSPQKVDWTWDEILDFAGQVQEKQALYTGVSAQDLEQFKHEVRAGNFPDEARYLIPVFDFFEGVDESFLCFILEVCWPHLFEDGEFQGFDTSNVQSAVLQLRTILKQLNALPKDPLRADEPKPAVFQRHWFASYSELTKRFPEVAQNTMIINPPKM